MIISKQQLKAVYHTDGPALVLAVPGSGKTTVLLNRIIYLNNTQYTKYKQILNLTFSRTQAFDMKSRFSKMSNSNDAIFSTIHAFAYGIIKLYSSKYKIKYSLIEGSNNFNKYKLITRLIWENFRTKPTTEDIDFFFNNYGLVKNNMIEYKDLPSENYFSKLMPIYESFKEKNHLIDFDDMLTLAYNILITNDDILKKVKNNYKYIQLDEGQDSSLLQFKLLELISYPENNIFILADDDQSIYSFRGANPSYLLNIESVFKDIHFYNLNRNYRSKKDIVMLSDYIIKNNKDRYKKIIESHSNEKTPIQVVKTKNLVMQNKYILEKIENLEENENLAILFRNNISAYPVANNLLENNIQFNKRLNFKSNAMKLILNDLKNIIEFSFDQSNLSTFKKIYYKLNLYLKKDYVNNINISFNESILDYIIQDSYIKEYQHDLVLNLKNILNNIKGEKLSKTLEILFEESNYIEYISKHNDNIPINFIQELLIYFSKDLDNINELQNKIENIDKILKENHINNSNIFISTIHQSKGLEYDNVLLIDLVDGEFPVYSDRFSSLEEERRLFYVAITRAKNNLFLMYPKYRSGKRTKPSKFLKEISHVSTKRK